MVMKMAQENGQELLHTPGGVRDTYGDECARKHMVGQNVKRLMNTYGFRDIETPTFEYFDIFSKERGTVASKRMFKFFDRGNNTLVLRPDMTPSLARCIAKYYRDDDMQIRLCYLGNTFVNTTPYEGKLQEVTQIGAELYNDDTSDADAEMVALTAKCLLESGLDEFQIEVGHADILNGLVEEAGFGVETAETLRELMETKNFFGVEDLLDELTVSEPLRDIFMGLPEFQGNLSDAAHFIQSRCSNTRVLAALNRLMKVEEIINTYGFSDYVTVDLSMLSGYSYYTGVVFKAYTYGNGEAVASGGRYDGLVGQFGKDAPAIGMAIVLEQLVLALSRQKLFKEQVLYADILLYTQKVREQAIKKAEDLRAEGRSVQLLRKSSKKSLEDYIKYAHEKKAAHLMYMTDDGEIKTL